MTVLSPWDIVVAFVLISPMIAIALRWRRTMGRWRWGWYFILALAVGYELWAQFDSDPSTFTFSEGLTRNFSLPQLWIAGTIIFLVLQIHWPDLVRRGYGKIKQIDVHKLGWICFAKLPIGGKLMRGILWNIGDTWIDIKHLYGIITRRRNK